MNTTFRRHQLQHTLITGAGPSVVAAAKVGFRVVLYAYALAGAANLFEDSDGTDLSGVLPAGALATQQPDFLLRTPNDKGLSVFGGGSGFVVWAYERIITVAQNF